MQIRTVQLPCLEPEEMVRFYGSVLGLPVVSDDGCVSVSVGTSRLEFWTGSDAQPQHFAFNVDENRFANALDWVRSRTDLHQGSDGTEVFRFEDWKADAAYFRDPAGNILEIISRQGIPGSAQTPLLSISEVGVVCDDVLSTAQDIETQTGLTPYRPISETFGALGDIHGLLVLVPEGREWYPQTGVAAHRCKGNVTFQLNGQPFTLDLDTLAIHP